jgi:DNA-binding protein HU-beta
MKLYSLTLHPDPVFPQVRNAAFLCTTCAGVCGAVEELRKTAPGLRFGACARSHALSCIHSQPQNPPRQPQSGSRGCKTGFRRGFSQLTFSPERGKYEPSGFPLSHMLLFSRLVLGIERDLRGETMNKADLVDKIAGACEMSKAQAATAIDTAVSSITGALRKGDRVALIGFGTFSVSQRKARNGRNPQTGATIKIAARKVAKFTPGAELKKTVNKK